MLPPHGVWVTEATYTVPSGVGGGGLKVLPPHGVWVTEATQAAKSKALSSLFLDQWVTDVTPGPSFPKTHIEHTCIFI